MILRKVSWGRIARDVSIFDNRNIVDVAKSDFEEFMRALRAKDCSGLLVWVLKLDFKEARIITLLVKIPFVISIIPN